MTIAKSPNFFILGAPKCGTTALYDYLREHPRIFMSEAKEPHYFALDFPRWRYVTTEADYLSLFREAGDDCLAIGEASPWYLYSSSALDQIKHFAPAARVIVMIRNPVDMVYAQYAQNIYNLDEDVQDFHAAWELESLRRGGEQIPPQCRSSEMLYYSEIGRLGTQLKRALEVFGADAVLPIVFDDFIANPHASYEAVLTFLQVPSDGRQAFPRVNANRVRRFVFLARLLERPPYVVDKAFALVRKILGARELGLYRALTKLTTVRNEREPLGTEMRCRLVECYRDEVSLLESLLQRDFSKWRSFKREGGDK